jgi:hypothetical protein
MHVVTIGIQTIMPDTGTPQEQPSQQPDDAHFDNDALIADAVAKQGPPPPGMGMLLDKTA